jgi:glycosyltransferase involved in cell wall biosynthesis
LRALQLDGLDIERVIVWAHSSILSQIEERPWLELSPRPEIEGSLASRVKWLLGEVSKVARDEVDVLFVPGSLYAGSFSPVVTMSQNLLPFELKERRRYGMGYMRARLTLLEQLQSWTFRRSDGVVYLTRHHQEVVEARIGATGKPTAVINHGVSERFFAEPRAQEPITAYSAERPFRIIYTSIVDVYKHQWNIVEAIGKLRRAGYPVVLDLIGNDYPPSLKKLQQSIAVTDPAGEFVHYKGPVPNADLPAQYRAADAFVCASSCETFGQVLTEAMASGLPIACSNKSALPEVLGDAGAYFDPLDVEDAARCIASLLDSAEQRAAFAAAAFQRAQQLSWAACARQTFEFVQTVGKARAHSRSHAAALS